MKYQFSGKSADWLRSHGFREEEILQLSELLNRFHDRMMQRDTELIILPKDVPDRVAAMFHLMYSLTDADGRPVCFEKTTIGIPEEAAKNYHDNMELRELEDLMAKLDGTKKPRSRMYPRRRSSKYGSDR